jgi:hypothetical protein
MLIDNVLAATEVGTPGGIVGVILAILGIAGSLTGIAGYTRGSYAKSRIEALNGEVTELQRQRDEEKTARQETDRKLQAETEARKTLQDVVTGKQDWAEITAILRQMDQRGINIQHVLQSVAAVTGAADQ